MATGEHIVIVGGSLAGLRAAETLRSEGFGGTVTIVGDEPHAPYDRPPLSKQVLAGEWEPERADLLAAARDGLDVTWRRGVAASGLEVAEHRLALADGDTLVYDGLLIATGARARMLPGSAAVPGVQALRTLDDAIALRTALEGGARRVVVIGAGFIGAEVAATCRERGVEVVLVEPLPAPLARVLGADLGAVIGDLHREHGVDLRCGVGVDAVAGGADGRPVVHLSDGTSVDADVVVIGIGVIPNTEWLEGSGLTIDDGVVCDATTWAGPDVVAAGDVARWPNPVFDEMMRVEHWEHAVAMGAHAARRLLADGPGEPFAPVPWFWSDQYDRKIQLAGRVRPDDTIAIIAGSLEERRFAALYGRDGKVTGVLAMNMPARVVKIRRQLAEGLSWADAMDQAAV